MLGEEQRAPDELILVEERVGKAAGGYPAQRVIGIRHPLDVVRIHREAAVARRHFQTINEIGGCDDIAALLAGLGKSRVCLCIPLAAVHHVENDQRRGGRILLVEQRHQPRGDLARPIGGVAVCGDAFLVDGEDADTIIAAAGALIQRVGDQLVEAEKQLGEAEQKGKHGDNGCLPYRCCDVFAFHLASPFSAVGQGPIKRMIKN